MLAPANPKALLYGGFAAAVRGDRALARTRWQALKDLNPPPQIAQMLDARLAELGPPGAAGVGNTANAAPAGSAANAASAGSAVNAAPAGGNTNAASAASTANAAPAGTNASPAGTGTSAGGFGPAEVTVNISIAPALKSRLVSEAPLFVFAREPGSRGPPLAAKRLTSSALGTQVRLSPADSMLPGRVLASGQRVSITARVSFSGSPYPPQAICTANSPMMWGATEYAIW